MQRRVELCGRVVCYELERKKVKNINLRIKPGGQVFVSAPSRVPVRAIEDFMRRRAETIVSAMERLERAAEEVPAHPEPDREALERLLAEICEEVYPLFEPYGVQAPRIRIRLMKSRWGSCIPSKGVVTFNALLGAVPRACVEYVVMHEFTHFLQADHSKEFYRKLERFMPDWKERKNELKRYAALVG